VTAAIQTIQGVSDLENSLQSGQPTIAIDIKRQLAADLGLGVSDIGNTLRPLLTGDPISTWKAEDGESYNVRVRLNPDARSKIADLQRLALLSNDATKGMVKLTQIATFRDTLGPTQINRKDLNPEISISANASGRPAGDIGKDIDRALAKIDLPAGYYFSKSGANQDMAESISYAAQALLLAIIFIYLILASQFKSFLQPIAIMVSLPMALIGVFLALLLARSTLNIFSIIGFIMLMGLVTKNAILLIDFVNQARTEGLARHEAIIEAGKIRLRPILMTTLAMIFGMLPLALSPFIPGLGEGAESRAPMAQAVIGGIITSSLLTLVVVPVAYTYLDDFSDWILRRLKKNST
jgi:HAE1 family hydrophobic/amphiphilic exporter-1